MTHRAEQIIDAIAAALTASTTLQVAQVYTHRTLSLAEDQGELPAVSVDAGDDNPVSDTGTDNLAFIDSLLDVVITALVHGDDEQGIKRDLFDKRRRITQAIFTDDTLGLSFCMGTQYAGASRPQLSASGERMAGSYETRWRVLYRMNITDPGD